MPILDAWLRDMPQQFLGLPKIEVLISAFARQLQELEQVFEDLNSRTDLAVAGGKNLDYIGTIIPLSRKEAGILAGAENPDDVMSDQQYRQYLRYQNLINTKDCTYSDIMDGISLLWDTTDIQYEENPDGAPATIRLRTVVDENTDIRYLMAMPLPRSAGVGIIMIVIRRERAASVPVHALAAHSGSYLRSDARAELRVGNSVRAASAARIQTAVRAESWMHMKTGVNISDVG